MTDVTPLPGATAADEPAADEFEQLVQDYRTEIEALRRELKLPWLLSEKQASCLIPVSAATIRAEKAKIGYTSRHRMAATLQKYDKDCHRIIGDEGEILAFALRLANGRWGLFDRFDKRMSSVSCAKPANVLTLFNQRQ